ncbi:venom serine protease Bi-VSP-like isoform X2 [Halictus rubicundus]|uniref:venom serine protease Bi-VSP-like isoform X2 n=1 Tax=Halictus rubicundus TaxID=77578 RepID=UPI00403755D0
MLSTCVVLIGVLQPFVLLVSAQGSIVGQQCITPNNKPGRCNSINNCPVLYELLNQQGLQASDYVRRSLCALENNIPILCCPMGETNPGGNNELTTTPYGPLLLPDCGYVMTWVRTISGETDSQFGTYPWIAALGFRSKNNSSEPLWGCGGSLISARHVLTAAHCAVDSRLYMVRIGDLDLANGNDGAHPIDVDIEQKIVHPGYKKYRHVNDIAVLRLAQDVPFSVHLHPICLPLDESIRNKNFTGEFVHVVGWGATSDNASEDISFAHSDELQETHIPVVSNAECRQALSQFRSAVIDNRVLCAGFAQGGKDACKGDSGGPLMFPINKFTDKVAYYQIGVVSYGHGCARPGYPGVYARVTEYLDFIVWALK